MALDDLTRKRSHTFPHGGLVDGHGLESLDEHTCLTLLGARAIGRLGFSSGALPVIFPVNYVLTERTIVFGTEDGDKARAARNGAVACLEIDEVDVLEHDGWSVLATGRLGIVHQSRNESMGRLPLVPWALGTPTMYIEMPVELISGRRVRKVAP